ncbi:hypothetical protein PHLCEN_2v6215 [Hermanssonia centrifuga]|uniref:Uncharacterized protein n=1 Tax=Hermanssonia centrifuga TaxID=98765 RepID=A0A2R6P037_9APHY|nr:hypothetical protein PHLCEN_2v6215 [Hermanssonia centrifuga]
MHSDEDPNVDDEGTDIFEVFKDSPFLEELTIVHTHPLMPKCVSRSISGQKPLPLQHLRRLHLELPSSDLISILSSITTSKELETVLITSSDSRSTPPISSESARLLPSDPRCVPCLTRVLCLHLDIAAFVLEGFSHPLLKVPFLKMNASSKAQLLSTLTIIRSFNLMPFLQTVAICADQPARRHLEKYEPLTEDIIPLLKVVSSTIRCLELVDCSLGIIEELAIHLHHSHQPSCPRLSRLSFKGMRIERRNMIELCSPLKGRLKDLRLAGCMFDSGAEMERLQDDLSHLDIENLELSDPVVLE